MDGTEHQHVDLPEAFRVAAAASGAFVSLALLQGLSYRIAVFTFISGLVTSYFVGPLVCEYFRMETQSSCGAASFLTGVFGMQIIGGIWHWLQDRSILEILDIFRKQNPKQGGE